jgi:hypothetical protein
LARGRIIVEQCAGDFIENASAFKNRIDIQLFARSPSPVLDGLEELAD